MQNTNEENEFDTTVNQEESFEATEETIDETVDETIEIPEEDDFESNDDVEDFEEIDDIDSVRPDPSNPQEEITESVYGGIIDEYFRYNGDSLELRRQLTQPEAHRLINSVFDQYSVIDTAAGLATHFLGMVAFQLTEQGYEIDNLCEATNRDINTLTTARRVYEVFPNFNHGTNYSNHKLCAYNRDLDNADRQLVLNKIAECNLSVREAKSLVKAIGQNAIEITEDTSVETIVENLTNYRNQQALEQQTPPENVTEAATEQEENTNNGEDQNETITEVEYLWITNQETEVKLFEPTAQDFEDHSADGEIEFLACVNLQTKELSSYEIY